MEVVRQTAPGVRKWPVLGSAAAMIIMIPVAILGISLLVIVHEFGHYLMARAFGMRVTRFSIGFGPTLASFRPRGSDTVFQICAIPFLAYVMIAGMNPAEEFDRSDESLYPNKGVFARIMAVAGGPLANYIAASVLTFGLAMFAWPDKVVPLEPMTVGMVEAGTPAGKAGLEVNDVIVEANGEAIKNVEDLIRVTRPRAGKATEYVYSRAGKTTAVTITPRDNAGVGQIGVSAKSKEFFRSLSVKEALWEAVRQPMLISEGTLLGIANMVKQRTTEGLTGPVGMGKAVVEQAQRGLPHYIQILIYISVALGMFNLLPFPGLDGGRLVFLAYELITRKRANERVEAMVHAVGIVFLLCVIVLVTWRDIVG